MSGVYIKGLNIEPSDDGFDGKGLVIIGYDDKLYAVAHEQIIPLPDHGELIDRDALNTIKGKTLLEAVYYAPVIIPAERSEDAQKAD